METTRRRERRRTDHARRISMAAMREAGSPADVGRALGKSPSTVRHERTSRTNPVIEAACDMLMRLRQMPGCDPAAIRRRLDEAMDLEDLTAADDETLIERGIYLIDHEDEVQAEENSACRMGGDGYWEACRKTGVLHTELSLIGIELAERGVDLLDTYRGRKAGRAA